MARPLELKPGQKFEGTMLTYLNEAPRTNPQLRRASFRCDCGKIIELQIAYVRHLNTTSCGCRRSTLVADKNNKHSQASRDNQTGAYRSWSAMKQRVKVNPGYKDRPISADWESFEKFYQDMGDRPENHSLEREDNTKGYNSDNCVWATKATQSRNRSNSVFVTLNGVTKNLIDWCTSLNMSYALIKQRRQRGMTVEEALTTPINESKRNHKS